MKDLKLCKKNHPKHIRISKRGVMFCDNCPRELKKVKKVLKKLK